MTLAPDRVEVRLPSHPRHLPLIRALVEEGAAAAGFDAPERERIALAVTEGVTNVIRHGYGGATDRPIQILIDSPNGVFRLAISDHGQFVPESRIRSRSLDDVRPGGLGVHLMRSTMDTVEYSENAWGGTTLTLTKRLPPGETSS